MASFDYSKIQLIVDELIPRFGKISAIRQQGGMTGPAHLRVPAPPVDLEAPAIEDQKIVSASREDIQHVRRTVFFSGGIAVTPKKGDLVAFAMTAEDADTRQAAGETTWLKVSEPVVYAPAGLPLLWELRLES